MRGAHFQTPIARISFILILSIVLFALGALTGAYAEEDMKPIPACPEFCGETLIGNGSETLADPMRTTLAVAREDLKAPGVSAAVYQGGELIWAGSAGFADVDGARLATVKTKFRLGSTSKSLFATLVYRLHDRGVINVEAPISTYMPDLPADYGAVTLKALLSHTAGVRGYKSLPGPLRHEFFLAPEYENATEGLEVFIDDPVIFEPGTGFQYSAWGYSLASAALEAATGKALPSLFEDELFAPLGLDDTLAEFAGRNETPLTAFYTTDGGMYGPAPKTNNSVKWATGGLIATPSDVARFGGLLAVGEVVSHESLNAMWTPVWLTDGTMNEQNYGQGFRIDDAAEKLGLETPMTVVHHGGLALGGASFVLILPENGLSISVQANTSEGAARNGVEALAYELARIYLAADKAH